jgi:hypothetical protein
MQPWSNLRFNRGISLEGQKNPKKNIIEDSQFLGTPECEAGVPVTRLRHPVQ